MLPADATVSAAEFAAWRRTLDGVRVHEHVGLLASTEAERAVAVAAYLAAGLERGERCVCVGGDAPDAAVDRILRSSGADVDAALSSGALIYATAREVYLPDGSFDPPRTVRLLANALHEALAAGFPALRATGNMSWVTAGIPGADRLPEYEARVGAFYHDHRALGLSQYDLARTPVEALFAGLRTHRTVIAGGQRRDNPFYARPGDRDGEEPVRAVVLDIIAHAGPRKHRDQDIVRGSGASRHSRQFYRDLLEQNAEAIVVADVATRRFHYANQAAARLLGYTHEQFLQMSVEDLHPPGTVPAVLNRFLSMSEDSSMEVLDVPCIRADGQILHADIAAAPIEVDGRPALVGFFRDATARRRTDRLKRRIARDRSASGPHGHLPAAVDTLPDFLVVKDRDLRYREASASFCAFVGRTRQQVLGCTDYDLFPREDAEAYRRDDMIVIDSGLPQTQDEFVHGAAGDRWLQVTKVAYRSAAGEVLGVVCSTRDVEERRRAEAALRAEHDRLELALHASGTGAWDWYVQEGASYFDDTVLEMLGLSRADTDPSVSYWRERTHPDDIPHVRAALQKMLTSGSQISDEEHRVRHRNGSWVWLRTRWRVVEWDDAGAPVHAAGVIENVTGRRVADAEARRTAERLDIAMAGAGLGAWDWLMREDRLVVDDRMLAIVGLTRDAWSLEPGFWSSRLHPDDYARTAIAVDAHVAGKVATYRDDYRIRHGSGTWIWVRSAGRVVERNPDGTARRMAGTLRDVTAEHEAEQRLRESRTRLELAAEAAGLGSWDWNTQTRSIGVDARAARVLGLEAGVTSIGLEEWIERVHPDDRPATRAAIDAHVAGDAAGFARRVRVQCASGAYRRLDIKGRGLEHNADGRPVRICGTIRDVTGEHEAERLLAESRERLDLAMGAAEMGSWEFDLPAGGAHGDARCAAILGYLPNEMPDTIAAWTEMMHPDDSDHVTETLGAHLRGEGDAYTVEHRARRKDGTWVWLQARGRIVERDGGGAPVRICGTVRDATADHVAAQTLRDSLGHLALALEATEMGTWEWDSASGTTSADARVGSMLGLPPDGDHVQIHGVLARVHPDDRAALQTAFEAHIAGEARVYACRVRMRHEDGRYLHVSIRGKIVDPGDDHRSARMIGTIMDVSAEHEAQRRLRESEERATLAMEGGNLGAWDWNVPTGAVSFSPELTRMLGYELSEAEPNVTFWSSRVHPDDWPAVSAAVDAHMAGETEIYETEHRLRHRDGRWIWVLDRGKALEWDAEGRPLRLCGTHLDITARREAAERIHRQSEILRRMAEGVCLLEPDTLTILWANTASERAYGCEPGSMVGKRIGDLCPHRGGQMPEIASAISNALQTSGQWRGEFETGAPDGPPRWCATHVTLLDDPLIGSLAICVETDITERRCDDERRRALDVRQANVQRMESLITLSGSVAHRFNNLLTVILGNAELAQLEVAEGGRAWAAIAQVLKATGTAADLTREMLAYSGHAVFQTESVKLDCMVRDAMPMLRVLAPRHIEVRSEFDADTPLVQAGARQLMHAVSSLVSNAAEAIGEEPGVITIRTGALDVTPQWISERLAGMPGLMPGRYAALTVSDTGAGMDGAVRNRVFEPFFSTKFVGRGLGLAAADGVVRAHDGAIGVESAPGEGSTFTILLPCATPRL